MITKENAQKVEAAVEHMNQARTTLPSFNASNEHEIEIERQRSICHIIQDAAAQIKHVMGNDYAGMSLAFFLKNGTRVDISNIATDVYNIARS